MKATNTYICNKHFTLKINIFELDERKGRTERWQFDYAVLIISFYVACIGVKLVSKPKQTDPGLCWALVMLPLAILLQSNVCWVVTNSIVL